MMPKRAIWGWVAFCGLAAGGFAGVCRADVVEMTDGRRFEGRITAERTYDVVIDTMVNKIRLNMTLQRSDIRTVTRSALPDGFFDKPAKEAGDSKAKTEPKEKAPRPAPAAPSHAAAPNEVKPAPGEPVRNAPAPRAEGITAGTYLEVPLEGEFGRDIYPKGVEAALALAVQRGVQHVVFRIHSPGGEVWAARKIMEVLKKYDGKVTTHAFIEEAMSASIWVVFACDEVEIAPAGVVGAAVVFHGSASTGAAAVDEKMNSALAGELSAVAERHGRDPAVVRAMMIPEAELYEWEDAKGRVHVSGDRPATPPSGMRVLSSASDVLTLTANEASRIGLATQLDADDSAQIGAAEAIDQWAVLENAGALAMQKACKQSALARADLERTGERLHKAVVQAVESDPTRFTYKASSSGIMTPDSQRRWTELTDKALTAWADAKRALVQFKQEQTKAAELDMEGLAEKIDAAELKTTLSDIDVKMGELRQGRSRERLPADFQRK